MDIGFVEKYRKVSEKYIYFTYCYKTLKFFKVHPLSVDTLLPAAFPRLEGPGRLILLSGRPLLLVVRQDLRDEFDADLPHR